MPIDSLGMIGTFVVTLLLFDQAAGQQDIASWYGHGVVQIRDRIYIIGGVKTDGSFLDGRFTNASEAYPFTAFYDLNLNSSISLSNFQNSLEPVFIPEFDTSTVERKVDAFTMANSGGILSYGGIIVHNTSESTDFVAELYNYQSRFSNPQLRTISSTQHLFPSSLTAPYQCCGADISAPTGFAYKLGGLVTQNGGPIFYNSFDDDAEHVARPIDDLFICDLRNIINPSCEQLHMPDWLPARAEAGLVWLPYGEQGVLILLGGVTLPGDQFVTLPDNATTDDNVHNDFMTNIVIFDIASRKWHVQETLGPNAAPSQLAAFCSVVAESQDGTTQHLYVYGGYDGTYLSPEPNARDEVWVLSIPHFQWTKVSNGTSSHRRKSHRCVKPYPNQMISIGGAAEYETYLGSNTAWDVLNLNTLEWNGTYDPLVWDEYSVPPAIVDQIGGSRRGMGKSYAPSNLNGTLNELFSTRGVFLNPTWYPYATTPAVGIVKGLIRSIPDWFGILLAILAYLCIASPALTALVILRRRKFYRTHNVPPPEIESKRWIVRWMHNASKKDLQAVELKKQKERDSAFKPLTLPYVDEAEGETEDDTLAGTSNNSTSLRTSELSVFEEDGQMEMRSFLRSDRDRTP